MVPLLETRSCRRTAIYGPLVLDIDFERASIGTIEMTLQQSDWAILNRLAAAGGTFVRGSDLLSDVWGDDMRHDSAFLRNWVHRLNDRLGANGYGRPIIDTLPGGYRLLSPQEWSADYRRATR